MIDRAAVVTSAILQTFRRALLGWIDGSDAGTTTARSEIEALLRDEFSDVAHTTLNEIRQGDE